MTIAIPIPYWLLLTIAMKGTKVQTLGARAVAGAWCMHGWLLGPELLWPWVQLLIRIRTAN